MTISFRRKLKGDLIPVTLVTIHFRTFCLLVCFEVWSLKLRELQKGRVFENRMLRIICGPKKEEDWENDLIMSVATCILLEI
jgi:hypothetical protein